MKEKTILLVEDNPDEELLALDALAANRIEIKVVVVRNGIEALDYLFATGAYVGRDTRDLPVFMLLDLKMPKLNGLEVLRRIRASKTTRLLPVVILTSSNVDQDRAQGYSLGANSYLLKPVDFEEFVDMTGNLGKYWLYLNQPPPAESSI